ncbi:MAG: bifunctional nicotinamidase/pyrazinamidase [Deferribacteres bacterium]|nr:bifunctional nicotinamidase/pyrazinamidase [candidate division KSB1 bacterium]MCB9503440.1 bifunctional nicotinamidase/pyrazinamidase [Deferribacteres bacterium]
MHAFLMVDIQNDFTPGGALAVNEGDKIIPIANALQEKFELVIATQDWHPADHGSFAANHPGKNPGEVIELNGLDQILWPVHCVQESNGAAFHPELNLDNIHHIVHKGTNAQIDSYSSFFDNGHKKSTGLENYLQEKGVTELSICGLATDYCVKFSALDAVNLGFKTNVIIDACRGVELANGDVDKAIREMKVKGVQIIESSAVL